MPNQRRRPGRHHLALAFAALALTTSAGVGHANPIIDPRVPGIVRWRYHSVINVWVDPINPESHDRLLHLANLAADAWNMQPPLQDHGIELNVMPGESQQIDGSVNITFVDILANPKEEGETQLSRVDPSDDSIQTANIQLSLKNPLGDPLSDDAMLSLMKHELGHAIGMDDNYVNEHSIMYYQETGVANRITLRDQIQLNSIYSSDGLEGFEDLIFDVRKEGSQYLYEYDARWVGGTQLALFDVNIGDATIFSATAPEGWAVSDFKVPHDVQLDYPVADPKRHLAFVLADDESYLGPDHPELKFSFLTNQAPGTVDAFLNGPIHTAGPVPEPSTWVICIAGFGLAGWRLRRRERAFA